MPFFIPAVLAVGAHIVRSQVTKAVIRYAVVPLARTLSKTKVVKSSAAASRITKAYVDRFGAAKSAAKMGGRLRHAAQVFGSAIKNPSKIPSRLSNFIKGYATKTRARDAALMFLLAKPFGMLVRSAEDKLKELLKKLLTPSLTTLDPAIVGSQVICPFHGTTVIVTGSSSLRLEGQPVATIGDTTSCGATIISGSPQTSSCGLPIARIGDRTDHCGIIITGASSCILL